MLETKVLIRVSVQDYGRICAAGESESDGPIPMIGKAIVFDKDIYARIAVYGEVDFTSFCPADDIHHSSIGDDICQALDRLIVIYSDSCRIIPIPHNIFPHNI